jgi:2-polyprenyl-6-methoxyphenol hydroxylase-like FAD-dependent oxidoreductase
MSTPEAIVLGAGPAGASAALALDDLGVDVLVVERGSHSRRAGASVTTAFASTPADISRTCRAVHLRSEPRCSPRATS